MTLEAMIVLAVVFLLVALLAGCIVGVILRRHFKEPEAAQAMPEACRQGKHRSFRDIAPPYAKECLDCGRVVFSAHPNGYFPVGLQEYVEWVATGYQPVTPMPEFGQSPASIPHEFRPMMVFDMLEGYKPFIADNQLICDLCGAPRGEPQHVLTNSQEQTQQ